jgi:hypothetical protein
MLSMESNIARTSDALLTAAILDLLVVGRTVGDSLCSLMGLLRYSFISNMGLAVATR